MFGVPLGELDAYVPAGRSSGEAGQPWLKNQFQEAKERAKQENKLVLVTFTGYACTNCHWMKANMFPRPEIAEAVKDMVLVELYTDGTDKASEENQKLEDQTFSTVAIPLYAIFDADGKVVANFPGSTKNAGEFLAFLKKRPA
jgi:thiol:disulfide interchange protein